MANDEGGQPATDKDIVGGTVDDGQKGCFGSLLHLILIIAGLGIILGLVIWII